MKVYLRKIISLGFVVLLAAVYPALSEIKAQTPGRHPVIVGDFIQFPPFLAMSEDELDKHFLYLNEAGIKLLVLYCAVMQNPDGTYSVAYFPSETARANKGPGYAEHPQTMEKILKQCQKYGIQVFLTPMTNHEFWRTHGIRHPAEYKKFINDSSVIARELYDLYHEEYGDLFYGWYFCPEFSNYFSMYHGSPYLYDQAAECLTLFFGEMTKIKPLKCMMSPYFVSRDPYSNAGETAESWARILSAAEFETEMIFCPQDSVGAGLLKITEFVEYFKLLKDEIDKIPNVSLWSNPECFKQENWTSAPITRYAYQLQAVAGYVEGYISFAYSHYYAPSFGSIDEKRKYHDAYLHYKETGEITFFGDVEKPIVILSTSVSNQVVVLTAEVSKCRNAVSHVEFYRGDELIGKEQVNWLDYSKETAIVKFNTPETTEGGTQSYSAMAYDFLLNPSEKTTVGLSPESNMQRRDGHGVTALP